MRKFLIGLLLMAITYFTVASGCGPGEKAANAANQMLADIYYFTITDDIAPYLQNLTPAEGSAINPKNFVFGFDIVDDGSGVDLPTVEVTTALSGLTITKTETPIPNGYYCDIRIDGLGYGQRVDIQITGSDNAN